MTQSTLPAARRLLDWALSISDHPDSRPRAVCDVMQRVMGPTAGVSLVLRDPVTERFTRSATTVPGQADSMSSSRVRSSGGATTSIIREQRPIQCSRVSAAATQENPMLAEYEIESYIGAPVICGGRAIGALYVLNQEPDAATVEEIQLLSSLSLAAGDALLPAATSTADDAFAAQHTPEHPTKASVWDGILGDPVMGAALIDSRGVVRAWSPTMARHWGVEPECPISLHRFLPHATALALLGLIEKCENTGEVAGICGLQDGRRQITTCRLVRSRVDANDRYLISTVCPSDEYDSDHRFRRLNYQESSRGAFNALTQREIEVLALMGEGLGLHEIAARLYRSRKTIDNHRYSIGQKLGAKSLPELVAIAARAGLKPTDAKAAPLSVRTG